MTKRSVEQYKKKTMKMKAPGTGLISGKIGNMIYYVVDGKQYIRRAALPGKKSKREIQGIPAIQQGAMTRFSMLQSYYSFYREFVSDDIWKAAGRVEHCRADNLFHKTNSPCFDDRGNLVDFDRFSFSRGELLVPRRIALEGDGVHYRVTWEEERCGLLTAPDDELCIGVIYEARSGRPLLLTEVCGKRADCAGTFTLNREVAGVVHVYCFWAREDRTAFSESVHFSLA